MESVKEINIKNQAYNFFYDMTNIKYFDSNLLKIDKKSYKNTHWYSLHISQWKMLVIMKIFIV